MFGSQQKVHIHPIPMYSIHTYIAWLIALTNYKLTVDDNAHE